MDTGGTMKATRRRTLIEWTLSAAAVAIVVLVMVSLDTPARDYAEAVAATTQPRDFSPRVPEPIARAGRTAWRICLDHQPLAAFAGVATVLVLFMRRMR